MGEEEQDRWRRQYGDFRIWMENETPSEVKKNLSERYEMNCRRVCN